MCRKRRSTFISLTAVECVRWTHGIKIERNNLLCEQAPTEVFRSIFAWLVTLKLVWCKNSKNNEFRTKKFPNPEFLYGISSFCTLSENNSFLHGKISHFCIFFVKIRILNTELYAMSLVIHKIVSKKLC